MKLRNKKTGEILELCCHRSGDYREKYDSLAELNEEWEDVPEEPKKYYYITSCGETAHRGYRLWENESIYDKNRKQIGNYFETEEEAENAVEKLKAWKRLKDKGFRFKFFPGVGALDVEPSKFQIEITADMPAKWFCCDAVQKDLNLLFGGEE